LSLDSYGRSLDDFDDVDAAVLAIKTHLATKIEPVGWLWPDDTGRSPRGNVIYLTAEDTLDDTVVPPLMAAGGDCSCIYFYKVTKLKDGRKRMSSLLTDLEILEQEIQRIVIAVIFDPMSAYFGNGRIDSHNNTELRAVLGPITDLVERTT
jgi:hypothetical protein